MHEESALKVGVVQFEMADAWGTIGHTLGLHTGRTS